MAFPAVSSLLDDFNRADEGPPPSANWSGVDGGDTGLSVVSNQLAGAAGLAEGYWNPVLMGPDCEVIVDVPVLPPTSYFEVFLRYRAGPGSGYKLLWYPGPSSNQVLFFRFDNDAGTQLGSPTTATLVAGDSVGLEAIGDTITGYQKTGGVWSQILSRTDSTYNRAGYIGCGVHDTTCRLDNFTGGPPTVEVPDTTQLVVKARAI